MVLREYAVNASKVEIFTGGNKGADAPYLHLYNLWKENYPLKIDAVLDCISNKAPVLT